MAPADTRLTDPTAEEVASALRAAVKPAKKRKGVLTLSESTLQTLGKRVITEREGRFHQSCTGTRIEIEHVSLTWWTNAAGQKLVRVRLRRGGELRGEIGSRFNSQFLAEQRDRDNR